MTDERLRERINYWIDLCDSLRRYLRATGRLVHLIYRAVVGLLFVYALVFLLFGKRLV